MKTSYYTLSDDELGKLPSSAFDSLDEAKEEAFSYVYEADGLVHILAIVGTVAIGPAVFVPSTTKPPSTPAAKKPTPKKVVKK